MSVVTSFIFHQAASTFFQLFMEQLDFRLFLTLAIYKRDSRPYRDPQ